MLQDRMKKAGVKQVDIAAKANVSPAAVSLVVRGLSTSKRIIDMIRDEIEKKESEQNRSVKEFAVHPMNKEESE